MKFDLYRPCSQLQPFIRRLVISEMEGEQTYTVLPDTGLVMGLQYNGRLSLLQEEAIQPLAAAGITGLQDRYRTFRNTPATGTVLVVFQETGLPHFIRQPVHELFGQSLSLENLFSHQSINDVQEQLAMATNDATRISLVEAFLLRHLTDRKKDELVINALSAIHQSKGTIRISELAATLHTSKSPLEKRFRSVVGASPKQFANIVRVKHMIEVLQSGNLHHAEYLSSYYDQAHFIKAFKQLTSTTPEQYLRSLRTRQQPK